MNAGDTGFMLICSALVFFMTPGLAFFYGGLVRRKNVVSTMMACAAIMGLSVVMWVLFGYSLSFGGNHAGIIGDFRWFGLHGIKMNAPSTSFKSKEVLLCIFSDIRHSDLKLFFLLLAHHIEQAHLTDHGIFLFLLHMVDDLNINTHELLSCSPQDIQCPGFDEIFHQPFIHQLPARNPSNKIFHILLCLPSSFLSFTRARITGRPILLIAASP